MHYLGFYADCAAGVPHEIRFSATRAEIQDLVFFMKKLYPEPDTEENDARLKSLIVDFDKMILEYQGSKGKLRYRNENL